MSVLAWLYCRLVRGRHLPTRHLLGGFRCAGCGVAGADLEEMGFEEGGYVSARRDA